MLLLCTLLGLLAASNAGRIYIYRDNLGNVIQSFQSVVIHSNGFPEPVQNRSASGID